MHQDNIALAGIIHDMRNLMTVITLNSDMLSRQVCSEQSPLALGIMEAVEYLDSLLEDLEPDSHSHRILRKSQLDKTLGQVAMFARTAHPDVEFVFPTELIRLELRIDQDELLRCLMNLVINAAEAAVANAQASPVVEISVTQTSGRLGIHVRDSGNGFPNDPSRAFAPYVSAHANVSAQRGLGLYVVQSLVKSNGGSIGVRQNASPTVVSIEFPEEILG